MNKIIVTGGCGFIGSHLVTTVLPCADEIIIIDDLSTGFTTNLSHLDQAKLTIVKEDFMSLKKDLADKLFTNATAVFHLAARISVAGSMVAPLDYFTTNTQGTLIMLEYCKRYQIKNFVLSSSAAIYGDNPELPKRECMLPEPCSPYAISKLDGEYLCKLYRDNHGINAVSLRYFNVFGPRQALDSAYAAAIPNFIQRALKDEDILIYGDGEQTRDFIYVEKVVQANIAAARFGGDMFNVAAGQSNTITALAKKIIQLTRSKSKLVFQASRPGDIKHSYADISKTNAALELDLSYDFDKALQSTIEYYKSQ